MPTKMKWILVILVVVLMSFAAFSVALAQIEVVNPVGYNMTVMINEDIDSPTGQCGSVGAICGTG